MNAVTVIGEALTDIVVRRDDTTEHPGGSPMNVAIGLARLGNDTRLVTRIGTDDRGATLRHHIEQSGVSLFPGSIVEEATSTATALLDDNGAARYQFDIHWSLDSIEQLPPASILHTGSIAAFLRPGSADVHRLVNSAPEATIVTFDPNIRPSLLGDPASERLAAESLMALSNVVKLSDEDANWLYPEYDLSDVPDHIRSLGPALVIITQGAAGATLSSLQATIAVPGEQVAVADTIGAGDSFMSAVIHALLLLLRAGIAPADISNASALTSSTLTDIGSFAVKCAAITVSRAGAHPPNLNDLS